MAVYNLVNNMVKAVVCLALVAPVFFGVRNKWIAGEWFYFFHYILEAPAVTFLTRLLCGVDDLLDVTPKKYSFLCSTSITN